MTLEIRAGSSYSLEAPYAVTAGKIAEFAGALGEENKAFIDRAFARSLGVSDVFAPPTFGIIVAMPALERMLALEGVPMHRVVHGAQSFLYHQPICAGDELDATLTISSARAFKTNTIVVVRAELAVSGAPALTCDSTLVVAGETPSPSPGDSFEVVDDVSAVEPTPGPRPVLDIGVELGSRVVRLQRRHLVRYAGASGDFNPIHYSDHVATSAGLPGVIAHGMLTMGLAARTVTDALDNPAELRELSTKFVKPVFVPDDDAGAGVAFAGVVRKELDENNVLIELSAVSRGQKVLGMAKAVVRR